MAVFAESPALTPSNQPSSPPAILSVRERIPEHWVLAGGPSLAERTLHSHELDTYFTLEGNVF